MQNVEVEITAARIRHVVDEAGLKYHSSYNNKHKNGTHRLNFCVTGMASAELEQGLADDITKRLQGVGIELISVNWIDCIANNPYVRSAYKTVNVTYKDVVVAR